MCVDSCVRCLSTPKHCTHASQPLNLNTHNQPTHPPTPTKHKHTHTNETTKNQEAAVLRGPLASKVVTQLLMATEWGELDYLLLDMPPGKRTSPKLG
jgi:Mrp family chromosome partitioning ATPase